jgi:hypothetical protein
LSTSVSPFGCLHLSLDESTIFCYSDHVGSEVKQQLTFPAGVCQRRNWPDPLYQVSVSRYGYSCIVRVNNREYQTKKDAPYQSELLAKEAAATTAYTICANFSANDGMYPAGFASGGVIQGNPVPVGSGRHARRSESSSSYASSTYVQPGSQYGSREASNSPGSRSGHSSPETPTWALPSKDRRVNRHETPEAPSRHHREAPRNRHNSRRY